jgi:hypothetical protein
MKEERKEMAEGKELAIYPRLPRLPRKPAWLLDFKRRALAVKRLNPRQNNPNPCAQSQKTSVNPYGGPNARFNLF